ncbi:MAG TPA: hypothetical protein VKB04_14355 [Anaerolineales bacterium]|nr:hypothetical protein [Anaerolineales bacterium]
MDKKAWLFQPSFYLVMALYFILAYTTLGYGERWAASLYPEDHYFENIGAISLFVASGLSFYIFVRALKTRAVTGMHWLKLLVYLGLALLYFFGAGEEISWGQRNFHIQEPAGLDEENVQHELNIHDLAIFENNELLKSDTIFTIFWLAFAVLIPFGSFVWKRFGEFAEKFTPIVYWGIGSLFLFNYLGAKIAKSIYVRAYTFQTIKFGQAVQEIKESNYELMFVFLSLFVLWDLNRLISEKSGLFSDSNS